MPRFSIIDLVIGTGPKRNVSVPNVVGLTVREAKAIIANNLFEVGLVEHEDGGQDDQHDHLDGRQLGVEDARDGCAVDGSGHGGVSLV